MKRILSFALAASGLLHGLEPESEGAKVTHVPGQFHAVGGDEIPRGSLVLLAEEIKRDFCSLFELRDDWKSPIELRIIDPQQENGAREPIRLRLLEVDGLRSFILELDLTRGLDQMQFKRSVYSLVIFDHSLRNRDAPEGRVEIRPWLLDGIMESVDWKGNRCDRNSYRALFESGGVFDLDDLLNLGESDYQKMDSGSKAAFRLSSGVLVMALLAEPDGKSRFRDFLSEVADFQGEARILLSRHFPSVNLSVRGLEKVWSLQMANQGGMDSITDVMDIHETDNVLEDALQLLIRNEEGLLERRKLDEWNRLESLGVAERLEAVRLAEQNLIRLSYRCFPPYRALLREYQQLLLDLGSGKTRIVGERIGTLQSARRNLLGKADAGRDYLDWFEITRAGESSGEFRDYMRFNREMRAKGGDESRSTSRYLNRVNRLFER